MAARAFPYAAWPKVPRRDHDLGRQLRPLKPDGHTQAAAIAAQRLLGCPTTLEWGTPERCSAPLPVDAQVGLRLTHAERERDPLLAVTSRAVAQGLADAVLGGELAESALAPGPPLDPLSQGALVYLAARCLSALSGGYQVLDCVLEGALREGLAGAPHIRWPVRLRLGHRTLKLSLFVPESQLCRLPPQPPGVVNRLSGGLGALQVRLSARAGHTRVRSAALVGLAAGDIVLLDQCSLDDVPRRPTGHCQIHVEGMGRALLEARACDHGLTLVQPDAQEPPMTTSKQNPDSRERPANTGDRGKPGDLAAATGRGKLTEATAEPPAPTLAGDVPVALSLELARFTVSLATLAELSPGDVLETHTPIGAAVHLRAGDALVAEGELVDFEGDVGVRIHKVWLREGATAARRRSEAPDDTGPETPTAPHVGHD